MMKRQWTWILLALPACAAQSTSTKKSDITTAVPKAEWIDIQTAATTPLTTDAPAPAPAPLPATCQGGPPAMFAAMSSQVMSGANGVIGGILGTVGAITQTQPTVMTPDHAVWLLAGQDDPLVHKLDIARVAPDTYHFLLSGKPAAGDDSTWVGLFEGDVQSPDAQHATGDAQIDFAAIHSLDASSEPVSGQVAIQFANAPDGRGIDETFSGITGQAASQPNDAHYTFNQDTNGVHFNFVTQADFDHDGTADELLDVQAVFAPDGEGKASTTVTGGSLGSAQVGAVECWDDQQRVLFYADDMNANPLAGDPSCCLP